MKKIGLLNGNENSFQDTFIERINSIDNNQVRAESIKTGAISIDDIIDYDLIIDRVSNEVPFFRSFLKLASFNNVKIINSPSIYDNDDKFFYFSKAKKLGFKVPKTYVLPSKERPYGTNEKTMRNFTLVEWETIFKEVGFPAYIRPNSQNSIQYDYKIYNEKEFHSAYDLTGSSIMMLQESIEFEQFYRCYSVGNKVRIMDYDPIKPFHLRFSKETKIESTLQKAIEKDCIRINQEFGLYINSTEVAIKDGKHYFVELINPVPSVEVGIIHKDNFDWFLESVVELSYELLNK